MPCSLVLCWLCFYALLADRTRKHTHTHTYTHLQISSYISKSVYQKPCSHSSPIGSQSQFLLLSFLCLFLQKVNRCVFYSPFGLTRGAMVHVLLHFSHLTVYPPDPYLPYSFFCFVLRLPKARNPAPYCRDILLNIEHSCWFLHRKNLIFSHFKNDVKQKF